MGLKVSNVLTSVPSLNVSTGFPLVGGHKQTLIADCNLLQMTVDHGLAKNLIWTSLADINAPWLLNKVHKPNVPKIFSF